MKKALKIIGITILSLVVLVSIGLYALSSTICQNEVLSDVPSPDGKYRAVTFQRDCGATSGFSTQVSVIRSWWYLRNINGNAFVVDTNHGEASSGPGGGPEVQVVWLSPSALSISYHPDARVFESESVVGAVTVSYGFIGAPAANNSLQARRP